MKYFETIIPIIAKIRIINLSVQPVLKAIQIIGSFTLVTTNGRNVRRASLIYLELLDVPALTPAIAPVRLASIVLVHVDAQVPEVLEAVVHGNPLSGLALAYEK